MDGEVDAALAVLPGAVERIDDPHALSLESNKIVGALLAEYAVVRPCICEPRDDELMG